MLSPSLSLSTGEGTTVRGSGIMGHEVGEANRIGGFSGGRVGDGLEELLSFEMGSQFCPIAS